MKAPGILILAMAGLLAACTNGQHATHQDRHTVGSFSANHGETPARQALIRWWQDNRKLELFYITGDAQRAENAIRQGDASAARYHCGQVDADTTGLPLPSEQKLAYIPADNAAMLAFDKAIGYCQGAAQVCEQTAGQPASAVQADLSIAAGEFSNAVAYVDKLMSYLPGGRT